MRSTTEMQAQLAIDLTAEYGMNGMSRDEVIAMNRRYLQTMPDSQVKVLMHLSTDAIEHVTANYWYWKTQCRRITEDRDRLSLIIEDAPHAEECLYLMDISYAKCDCWKSEL